MMCDGVRYAKLSPAAAAYRSCWVHDSEFLFFCLRGVELFDPFL